MDCREITVFKTSEKYQRHPWELARVEILFSLIREHISSQSTILDIGCGDGYFLERVSGFLPDTKLIGVDIKLDEGTKEYFKQNPRVSLYRSFEDMLGDGKIVKASIDAVLLLDVLEHVEDEVSMLEGIVKSKAVNDKAVFLITGPAFPALFSLHDQWLGHCRRYTVKQLSDTIEKSGLRVVESGYIFPSILIFRAIEVFFEKLGLVFQKEKKGIGGWAGNDFINKVYKNTLVGEYKLTAFLRKIGLKLPGLSCYAICCNK
ncbi:MAG: methyltransferase domain-containing protein [Candidatus Omnitrophica bacterium]|nr:methyltransferase domain-containing protein [Candidatus Omnitrophota bacterium]